MSNALWAALVKAQAEFDKIAKDRTNPHFKSKYATMASIIDATRPALAANGLAVTQIMEPGDGTLMLRTILAHASGEKVESVVPLLALGKGAQPFGSELTYMRRYSYAAILNVVADEDDDGNTAQGAHKDDAKEWSVNPRPPAPPKQPSVRDDTPEKRGARKWLNDDLRTVAGLTTLESVTKHIQQPAVSERLAKLGVNFPDLAVEYQEAIDAKERELSNNEVMGGIPA